ncbi:outer membrane protein [Terrarubrum flagellatum]|uniref:outer membrane protein n=1 Tax=Terrirubrum flagellatum TaxID=2895980 RepID=UPI003144E61C
MRFFRTLAVAALAFTGFAAQAADLPARVAPMPPLPMPYNWTGFYVGAQGGYGWSDTSYAFTATATGASHSGDGWFVGGRVGYNYQFVNNLVLGVEGEANWSDIDGSTSCPGAGFTCGHKVRWFGSVNGRLGYAIDRLLLVADGGVAFADMRYRSTATATGVLFGTGYSETFVGWTIGGGAEYALTNNLIVSLNYKYYDFRSKTAPIGAVSSISPGKFNPTMHTVRVGLAYKF